MRIAVALPSTEPRAPHRDRLDAVIAALGEGHEVELFGESLRVREGDAHHYLRFDARHRERPFDAALYPIGRDFRVYEPAIYLARRFPSLAWLLDAVVHHLLVGGVAQRGRWDDYLETMQAEFGDAGWRAGVTVAWGWGSRALYRCFDPAARELGRQPVVAAASPAIAGDVGRFVGASTVVPLSAARPTDRGDRHGVVVLTPDLGRPLPGLRVLARYQSRFPDVPLTYCVPQNVYEDAVAALAAAEGLADRLRWRLSPSATQQAELVDRAAVVVAETTDPALPDRSLVERAVAGGATVVLPRVPGWEEIPEDAALRISAGRDFGATLEAALVLAQEDTEVVSALAEAGRRWVRSLPDAATVAGRLGTLLERAAAADTAAPDSWHAGPAWRAARRSLQRRAAPSGASAATRGLIADRLDEAAAGIRRAADSR